MLEKIESNINNIKKKIDHRVWSITIYVLFGAALLFGMQMTNMYKRQKQIVQDEYNKSMYELVNYVKNVEVLLSKARITSTPLECSKTYADIWRQSNLAKENLATLPVNQQSMANTSKFLAQVSDFSYSLMKQSINNEKITDEQYNNLKDINDKAEKLTKVLNTIYDKLNNGKLKWNEVEKKADSELGSDKTKSEIQSSISKISETFTEYEGLIYDGAFSDHITSLKPQMIEDASEVTEEEAKQKAKEILEKAKKNSNIEYIDSKGESSGKLDVYIFEAKYTNETNVINIEITKKGGFLSLFVYDKDVKKQEITEEECEKIGVKYLQSIGINDVKATYYLIVENMITINYASVQNNITLYPDLIKVKIAMDTGEICSVETSGYLFNHKERKDIKTSLTIDEAKNVLNKNIEVYSEGLAIIPTESKNEILVYEFKGKINDKDFIIYVNANTYKEEKVLLIINTEGGTLTM